MEIQQHNCDVLPEFINLVKNPSVLMHFDSDLYLLLWYFYGSGSNNKWLQSKQISSASYLVWVETETVYIYIFSPPDKQE